MTDHIEAICFDVGGTLRATIKNHESNLDYIRSLQTFLGEEGDPADFLSLLRKREKEYRQWCKKTLRELPETELWTRYMLPDFPGEFVWQNAITLNQMWRSSRNNQIFPDAVFTIKELSKRGYKLSIVSNTTSSIEARAMLAENGLSDYFDPVILSCVAGSRKPHPAMFLQAARGMGVLPQNCAYVGDNPSRDLIGAMQAGFGAVIIINMAGYQTDEYDPDDDNQVAAITETKPQHHIGRLSELLEIFPEASVPDITRIEPTQPDMLYDISLSTMWSADQKVPFNETFEVARKLGFVGFEFNNKITPRLYQSWDREKYYVATIHDPCPSEFSYAELKRQDVALSSLVETQREKAVDNLKRSIDLAVRLGARSVVVHCGAVHCDHSRDKRLRELYLQGKSGTTEYVRIQQAFIADRNEKKLPHLSQVIRSLQTIIPFARGSGIAIALENRNRYQDLPLPDEMETLLQLCNEPWFGFQYDAGHAHNLEVLGMVGRGEWLRRFHHRLIGIHLHDVNGLQDHLAPGMGEVDFSTLAPYLVDGVLRTLEVSPDCTTDQIARGLEILVDHGCVKKV